MIRFFPSTIRQVQGGVIPIADALVLVSVRKINPSYTGFCMRVFRASDATSQDISFVGDYVDESAISAFCTGTTGHVSIWYDQSGNGNDFNSTSIQSVSTLPIIYQAGNVLQVNGKAGLLFNGASMRLLHTVGGSNATSIFRSAFSVIKVDVIQTINYMLWSNADVDGLFAGGTFSGVTGFGVTASGTILFQNTVENTNQNQHSYIGTPIKKVYTNGANEAIDDVATDPITMDRMNRNAANLFLRGYYQECFIYTTDKDSERTIIENDQMTYYGI